MDSTTSPPPTRFNQRFAVLGAIALAAVLYAWFIYRQGAPYAGGSDSSGYLNSARLLAQGRLSEPARVIPGLNPPKWDNYFYQPLGCSVDAVTARLVPSYPIGLPLHYVAAAALVGFEKAARLINVLNVLVGGALLYGLGRLLGLGRGWALGGVALLWACPVWIYQSLQPMSDTVATTWALAALYCAWRARSRLGWAIAAGAAFAMAVLVRPTGAVIILPLLVILGSQWRAWIRFGCGGLPFAVALGAYNFAVYGRVLETGYNHGGHNIFDAFAWEFLGGNLRHFAWWIPLLLAPPVVILAVLGLPGLLRRTPRTGLFLLAWVAGLVGLYACYYCAGETWWYLRFLLPAFPAVILAGLLAGQHFATRLSGHLPWLVPTALLLARLGFQYRLADNLHVTWIRDGEKNYWLAGNFVREQVPADAILLAWNLSGSLLFYNTQAIVRWDLTEPWDFALLCRTAAKLHRPIYAPLFGFEKAELQKKLGGEWVAVGHPGNVTVWRLVAPPASEVAR